MHEGSLRRGDLQVVKEPCQRRADHGLPISLDNEPIRDIALDGMPAVLRGLDHLHAEDEQYDRKNEPKAKTHSPDPRRDVFVVCLDHDKGHHTGNDETKVYREVGGHGDQEASSAPNVRAFVGCFGTAGAASWVFA